MIVGKLDILNSIFNLPYSNSCPKNINKLIGHETLVKQTIENDKFREINISTFFDMQGEQISARKIKNIEKRAKQVLRYKLKNDKLCASNIKGKYFIYQPLGHHSSPDFILISDGIFVCLELKSNKKEAKIVWNSGRPKHNWIYLLSCPKRNYYFLGQDYPGIKDSDVKGFQKEINKLIDELKNKALSLKDNTIGENIYLRPMYNMLELDTLGDEYLNKMKENVERYVNNL